MSAGNRLPDPDSTEFSWESYEELVKDIYEALGRVDGVTIECWGRRCTVPVAGGVQRQVDVLTALTDREHTYRTAISCKCWNARVNVAHVSDFALIVQDARVDKGIIVSKMGFTTPAQNLAKAKGIGLVELRKPLDADWEGNITRVKGEIVYLPPPVYDYRLSMARPGTDPRPQANQTLSMDLSPLLDQLVITEPDGHSKTLSERVHEVHPQPTDEVEFVIDFPDGTFFTLPDDEDHPVNGAELHRVDVHISVPPPLRIEIDINAAEHIYMIMESLFDGRRFNITNDGEIIETR